ncbi:hypothetical protein AtNW77_Chr1g0014651 [Arabidopsis thaliana]|uniref:At1g13390 n=4 Tax=Arabidopsis TaxID=3701 RepID=Q9FX58_ARATH|nr:translocase subunit seca [Arabidopsis thaliana]NP_849654.1 translocase subunit seca [Arabidopsis thaliana]KAG7596894.1 hypothetical protein ISN44_As06g013160 [Arabidopsis suecica]KAG7646167.1 hypothetical protein ISN45_At01g013410 [Arabidopsis thaliana x Arabidopsis arenosa]AAG09563.1 Unknown protein [Arabidopsis thaliana]AAY17412.1 At1g13390 [Arabidopsis thaliana]ABN04729.1 At1g13390 [Arabidopsis thaliana]|eukprot:NP_172796.1 translocase subunit seca [Arabidopsis thaliana]
MMNSCGIQQNAFEEMRRNAAVSDRRDAVICPKPRRVGALNHHSSRSLRWQLNHQMELCESNSGSEILDFILTKGGGGGGEQDQTRTVMTPPLFFTGSPPSRVSNPLTKDSLFREELLMVASPSPSTPRATKPQPPSSPRNGSCVMAATSFGNNPVVRVVGFDCDRRSSNRSISTLA